MTPDEVHEVARALNSYATHFAPRDWDYTRQHDIAAIRHQYKRRTLRSGKTVRDYDHPLSRISRAIREILGLGPRFGIDIKVSRWRMARQHLRRDPRLPDGILDNGNVITHWEETGEYLQFVQPTVGAMLADFLKEQPDHPHAQRIATEMRRIQKRYSERIEAGEVLGSKRTQLGGTE